MKCARLTLISLLCSGLSLGGASEVWAGSPGPERPAVQRPSKGSAPPSAASEERARDQVEPASADSTDAVEPAADPDVTTETASEPTIADPDLSAETAAPTPSPAEQPKPNALPNYADVVEAPSLTPRSGPIIAGRKVPRDGRGMLALGSLVAVGGAGLIAGSIVLAVNDMDVELWAPTLVLGAVVTGGAAGFLVGGRRRHRAYTQWEAEQADDIPRQGSGLVASGALLVSVGAAAGMLGTIGWAISNVGFRPPGTTTSPIFPASFGVGLGSIAVGSTLLILGVRRHKRFGEWRDGGLTRVQMLPTLAPLPGGGQIGLVGRF